MEHLNTVITERAKYPTPLGNENAWKVCNGVCLELADGWGLLSKPSGNNWLGYSVDVIINAAQKQVVDILGDSEGAGTPQWSVLPWDDSYASRWREPVPDDATPPTPPDPPDEGDLEGRVVWLENMVNHIVTHLRAI